MARNGSHVQRVLTGPYLGYPPGNRAGIDDKCLGGPNLTGRCVRLQDVQHRKLESAGRHQLPAMPKSPNGRYLTPMYLWVWTLSRHLGWLRQ